MFRKIQFENHDIIQITKEEYEGQQRSLPPQEFTNIYFTGKNGTFYKRIFYGAVELQTILLNNILRKVSVIFGIAIAGIILAGFAILFGLL